MRVRYEELWEPWHIGEDVGEPHRASHDWPVPDELADRFRKAKQEMEAVWQELLNLRPDD